MRIGVKKALLSTLLAGAFLPTTVTCEVPDNITIIASGSGGGYYDDDCCDDDDDCCGGGWGGFFDFFYED